MCVQAVVLVRDTEDTSHSLRSELLELLPDCQGPQSESTQGAHCQSDTEPLQDGGGGTLCVFVCMCVFVCVCVCVHVCARVKQACTVR